MKVDAGTLLLAAAALVFVLALAAAVATERGRRALAEVGIAFAWLMLRMAERAADAGEDPDKQARVRDALDSLQR